MNVRAGTRGVCTWSGIKVSLSKFGASADKHPHQSASGRATQPGKLTKSSLSGFCYDNNFMNCVCLRTDMGGLCTFCGAKVSLSKSGASEVRQSAVERLRQSKAGKKAASSSGQGPSSSAESDSTAIAEARAFKDRLVRSLSACWSCHMAMTPANIMEVPDAPFLEVPSFGTRH